MADEILYAMRWIGPNTAELAKFDDQHKAPIDKYQIVAYNCNCFQGMRRQYCKHRKIQDEFHKLFVMYNIGPEGVFYDYDRNLFYCPQDGEGIPIEGVEHILDSLRSGQAANRV